MAEPEIEDRVLVLMPTAQDAARTCEFLAGTGLAGTVCADVDAVCRELAAGAGAVLLTDEAVGGAGAERLSAALGGQPAWSDVPLVVLTREGADARHASLRESANVTLVERPVRTRSLLSVVRAALRARRRQYEVRDLLAERERAAETLRAERERLRITLSSIGDAVISTDAGGRVAYLNGVAEALTGWTQAGAEGRPLPDVFRILNEGTRLPVENPAIRALREGVVVGLANHTVLLARDGTERPIDDSAAPMRDGSGTPVGAVLVFRDVTERRRAEQAQARLAAIVESSDDAIVSKTLDGVIRSWNAGAQRTFGYTPEEAVGRPITLIIPPERLDEERMILDRIGRGERVQHFETVRVARDGRRIDVSLTVSPIRDSEGRVVGASKVARDVTARVRVDADLRDARARLGAALDAGAISTWTWDIPGDRLYGDENMGRLFSVAAATPGGLPVADYARSIHPEDWPRVSAVLARSVETCSAYEADYRLVQPDGAVRWVAARGRVEPDAAGRAARMAGVLVDVTERKRLEEELRARAEQLAEADRRKDEFLALLGHELRNPLAPIRNALEVLELRGDDPAVAARARAMIDRQATQLTRLVEELLDASRIARGKVRLAVGPLDLGALVRTVAGDHRAEVEAAGLALEVSAPPGPVWVRGDPARLAQVATNLLNNAVKFTLAGGRVVVRVATAGGEAVLSVSDTGVGIAADMLPGLFQAFRQVDADPARTKGGLGLGLAVVRGLVELHGGRTEAASGGAGRGSTFTVRLPLGPGREARHETPAAPELPAGGARRVLIVEDGADAAESLRELLELKGFEVAVASTGPDGVALARRVGPAAVVCDLGLPGMTGFEVARALRADPATAGAVLVAVSGYAQEEDRRKAREAGFDALLAKPADFRELIRLLARPGG